MQPQAPAAFAAFVGRAWADATYDICFPGTGSPRRELLRLDHRPAVIDAGGCTRRTRCNGQPLAVGLARNKGPMVSALQHDDCLGLFPVTPLPVATYREALPPSRATEAPPDAARQVDLLRKHRDKRTPLGPPSPTRRAVAPLVAHRQRLVGDTVRRTKRLPSALKNSFPHVLQWFQDQETAIFCNGRSRWPTLQAAPLARRATLERFCRAHHVRSADVITTRSAAITNAVALTTADGVIAPHTLLGHALVAPLRVTLHALADFDTARAQRAHAHPAFPLLDALPGAGAVFAPRLRVAFGAQRERGPAAAELQQYAGIAPVTERRGKPSWGPWRLQCPTFLRQTFVAWAAESIRPSCWAHVYDQQQRDKGHAHQAAVRALACTWIRMLYRCWQERLPYDASTYLQALHRRGSSLIQNLAKAS